MPNDKIMGIPTKACINGITKDQATNIKTIPSLDQRITALEEGGSSGGSGKTWVYKEMTLENLNKYLPIDESTQNRKINTPIIFGACAIEEDYFDYIFLSNDENVPRGNNEYFDYILSKEDKKVEKYPTNDVTNVYRGFAISLGRTILAIETNTLIKVGEDYVYNLEYNYDTEKALIVNARVNDINYSGSGFYRIFMYVFE